MSALHTVYLSYFDHLCAQLARAWPGTCEADLEDAVSHAFEVLLKDPALLEQALTDGGARRVVGLLNTISWRAMRATYRRRRSRPMIAAELLSPGALSHPEGQTTVAHILAVLPDALQRAAEQVSPRHRDRLVAALEDKFYSGDPDTAVARRHGVRREYLCRAKLLVMEQLRLAS